MTRVRTPPDEPDRGGGVKLAPPMMVAAMQPTIATAVPIGPACAAQVRRRLSG